MQDGNRKFSLSQKFSLIKMAEKLKLSVSGLFKQSQKLLTAIRNCCDTFIGLSRPVFSLRHLQHWCFRVCVLEAFLVTA